MNSTKFAVASIFGLLCAAANAGAGVCNVPSSYVSIQSAVNDVSCTTINVAPGVYAENVLIPRSLTLNGARRGIDARTRSGVESVINGGAGPDITITADHVTVDGFTLNGPDDAGLAAVVMQTGNTGETIKNNIVNNPGRAASITTSNTTFTQNRVNNAPSASDGFQANSTPVSNLTITNNTFSGADSTVYHADITVIEGNANVTISGNSSHGDGTLIALFKTDGAQIVGNTVVGDGGFSLAIYLGGGNSNVAVSGNSVTAANSAVRVANGYGVGANASVAVTGNTLINNVYGVRITKDALVGSVQAHRNSITGNSVFGISNTSTGSVDGTCNWWGSASGPGPVGPGAGDKVSTGVAYTSWLVSSNLNGPCIGGHVVTNKDQCKNDGWKMYVRADGTPFKNQGDCVSYTNNGK